MQADGVREKKALRQVLRAVRTVAREQAGLDASAALLDMFPYEKVRIDGGLPGIVGGYFPVGSEIDPRPLMNRFADMGWRRALPVVYDTENPLCFRAWENGTPLVEGAFGIPEPGDTQEALIPDLLLVPLLGFDSKGRRIGYGGGFYDRTLVALRSKKPVLAVGLAFSVQERERIPAESHDARLDWVVTECGPRYFGEYRPCV